MGIRKKMLISISVVFSVIYIFSGIFAYLYFANIFKERAISDDKVKLYQTEQQFQHIYDDVEKFSQGIIIDPQIQAFLKAEYNNGSSSSMSSRNAISERLKGFIFLRNYVQSAILISHGGENIYSLIPLNQDYVQEKLQEDWYKNYNKKFKYYFSNPHYIGIPGNSSDVISYIVDIKDIDRPEINIGQLVVNIKLTYFQELINAGISEFDDFIWLSQDRAVIFKKSINKNLFDLTKIMKKYDQAISDSPVVMEEKSGYVVADEMRDNGWRLISYTSKEQLFKKVDNIFYFFVFSTILSLVIILIVILPIVTNITKPITKLTKAMEKVSKGELDSNVTIKSGDEIEILGNVFNEMTHSLKTYIDQSITDEKIKRKMEFDLLISQINPHFIYNVLNTAVYMARRQKNTDIEQLITSFIKLLQDSIDLGSKELFTTVRHEMNIIEHYLKIQAYRYPEKFKIYYDVEEEVLEAYLPKTIIQPLVENALFHGICATDVEGEIRISAVKREKSLQIIVEDNGIGMEQSQIEELLNGKMESEKSSGIRHIGVRNIRDRVKFLYGEEYGIRIKSCKNKGTKISILIPFWIEK